MILSTDLHIDRNVSPKALLPRDRVFEQGGRGDLVIYVSDFESWIDSPHYGRFGGGATQTMTEWAKFKRRSPQAKMICIDVQPYQTTQATEREDIINVGGFSDQVFTMIAAVASGKASKDYWVNLIEQQSL